jgi:hypothetical protein
MAITVKHKFVSAIPDAGDPNIVQPSNWNDTHELTGLGTMAEQDANAVAITGGTISGVTLPASNITGTLGVPNGGTGASTLTGYVKGTGTTAMTAAATIPNTDITGLGTASTKDAGAALGVATLDATGKVPVSELPAAVLGALNYQGTWNALTNTPTLTSSVGTKGYYYVVNVAGTTNLNGITDWQVGDWAVYNGTAWQKVDNTDAGGDVVGPNSSTDNAITRFDGVTGRVIQNSTVTLDDNGNIINANSIGLDTTPATVPTTVGTMSWDDGDGVPTVAVKGGNVNLQVGTQELARVFNDSGVTITKGQVVYISGAQGNRVAVKLARADVEATSFGTIGLVSETIANGAEGFIIVSGALYKLNTLGLVAGATVYLSPTTAGAVTTTKPQAPDQLVVVGWVERVDNNVGSIYVKIDNGYELDELHDVRITSPQSGNILIYDATTTPTGVWKNANLTDGTGITITEGAGSVTIANAGVLTVSGTTGRITSTGGANPALDLTSGIATAGTTGSSTLIPVITVDTYGRVTSVTTAANPQGTVTSVTGTSPVVSSGGATPAISLAASYGDTQNPYASKTANNFLAAPNGSAGVPTFRAIVAADIPTLNQNTTGTASNVTGTVAIANGGTGATTAPAARTALGATTVGGNMFTLTNPSAVTFPRFNADNTVSALDAATFRTAIGAGTGSGTVTSVGGTGTVNGITLTGTVTTSGNLTLGGTLSGVSLTTQVSGTLPATNGGTGQSTYAVGDLLVGGATNTLTKLADVATGNALISGGVGVAPSYGKIGLTTHVSGTLPIANGGSGATTAQTAMNAFAGAVTSGSYLRGNGTNVVMATIQAADVPTLNQNTTGTASNVTGTVAIGNGGTGQTTATAAFNALNPMTTTGDILYEASPTTAARLGIGSTGQVLTVAGGIPSWANAVSSNITPNGMWENATTIAANYTIGTNNNAMSAGPITVNTGVTVTVPTGSTWTVV